MEVVGRKMCCLQTFGAGAFGAGTFGAETFGVVRYNRLPNPYLPS